jgi:uncharacterized membrane protein
MPCTPCVRLHSLQRLQRALLLQLLLLEAVQVSECTFVVCQYVYFCTSMRLDYEYLMAEKCASLLARTHAIVA